MFIRKTQTRNKSASKSYFTYRLAASERTGQQVRQITLLNLGRHFDLPQAEWPRLCARIDATLAGQSVMLAVPDAIETLVQRYAARLIDARPEPAALPPTPEPDFAEADPASVELTRPRSVGVEAVGLAAMNWPGIDKILLDLGFNAAQRAAGAGSLIGRMAEPGSECATLRWLRGRRALGELPAEDFDAMPSMRLYRASDLLVRHRGKIETMLFTRIQDLFALPAAVTLYDPTNTYFEGTAAGNPKTAGGRSKEKRSDCPLATLGMVLDGSGFVRKSKLFAGNAAEARTLQGMLEGLAARQAALAIMDAGIATEANIAWLKEHKYRYPVVSRASRTSAAPSDKEMGRGRRFDPTEAVETPAASNETIRLRKILNEDSTEVRLYCHSSGRETEETAIAGRFATKFEAGLTRLAEGLSKPRGQKKLAGIQQRIGRLKEKSRGIGRHYEITVVPDETGKQAASIAWSKTPVDGSMPAHPGVYCLRGHETAWDAEKLWHTYTMPTDLEAVFRSPKSGPGPRPVFHRKEERTEGHLFIAVLADQLVQAIRHKLKQAGEHASPGSSPRAGSWAGLREILSVQRRITVAFRQRDGRAPQVRKTTAAEPALRKIYHALAIDPAPGGVRKYTA